MKKQKIDEQLVVVDKDKAVDDLGDSPSSNSDNNEKPCVLIVDDQPANILLLCSGLQEYFRLKTANSGPEALAAVLESSPPDIILLDIMMPEMDGYEVCTRLRARESTKGIPIIMISALESISDEKRGFGAGCTDYIRKPFSLQLVKARVNAHLALKRERDYSEKKRCELAELLRLREDVECITRHDLKNPLANIIGLPGLLAAQLDLNEDQQQILKIIEDSGYQMLEMINLSLDLVKMERGTYPFNPQPVDLLLVFKQVLMEHQETISGRGIVVEITVDGEIVSSAQSFNVFGEKLLCYTLFSNLVKNAVEASPDDKQIDIALDNGVISTIRITNDGSVPDEISECFFDKYVTCGKSRGTGLGTYSAKLAVTTQDGDIRLDTSVPGSTSVIVDLRGTN